MFNLYRNYLPSKKFLNRILLKSLLGVLAGGVIFSIFFIILDVVLSMFIGPRETNYSIADFFSLAGMIFTGVILWTLLFASIPTMLGGILLSAIIFRDFKLGIASKRRSTKIGVLLAGLVGLSTSFLVVFTAFRPADRLVALLYSIPVTLIASLIGYWGAIQTHKEIENDLMPTNEAKEKIH